MSTTSIHPPDTPAGAAIRARRVRVAAGLAIAGVALYVVLDVIAQALPPHYSPISQAESDLAVGPYGWIMAVNFVNRGLLAAALLFALRQIVPASPRARLGFICAGIWTMGAFLLAAFPTDVGGGEHTPHGKLHLAIAFLAFLAMPIGERLLSRALADDPRWAWLGRRAQTPALVTWGGFVVLVTGARVPALAGLTERIFLASVLLWITAVAAGLLTTLSPAT